MNPGILTPPTQCATMPRGLLGQPTPIPVIDSRAVVPPDLSGLRLWLDAFDVSTFTLNAGSVSEWADKSGFGRHARQPTASLQPTLLPTGLAGRPALSFANDFLDTVAFANRTPCTVFAVCSRSNVVNTQHLMDTTGIPSGQRQYILGASTVQIGSGFTVYDSGLLFTTSPRILTARFAGSSSFVRVSGTQANGNAGNTSSTAGLRIGGFDGSSLGWAGLICEFLVYGLLSPSEITTVERYLSGKWGVPTR